MNRLQFLCGTAFVGLAGLGGVVALAQYHHGDPMAAGMGMGMMQGPTHQLAMTPFVLPELQSELGLSAQQVTQLRDMKQDMLTKGKALSSQIAAKRKDLDTLLATGTSRGELVKKQFEEIANLKAQQLYAGYETNNKMKAALTEAQRTKLATMKANDFHQTMMSRMTMNDMMEMMRFMGGDGMMMSGMMGQGMMSQGMMDMSGR